MSVDCKNICVFNQSSTGLHSVAFTEPMLDDSNEKLVRTI